MKTNTFITQPVVTRILTATLGAVLSLSFVFSAQAQTAGGAAGGGANGVGGLLGALSGGSSASGASSTGSDALGVSGLSIVMTMHNLAMESYKYFAHKYIDNMEN